MTDPVLESLNARPLPAWFDDEAAPGTQVDYMKTCSGAFQMTPGGYMVVRNAPGTEQQVFAATPPPAWRATKPAAARSVRRGAK